MRPFRFTLLLLPFLFSTAAAEQRNYEDAALHAIQFVDANEGWAVGDDGVIWHTINAGRAWERQPSGVRGSLRSVCFLNPYTGWIAGREELPLGAGSVGVLLFTDDGGLRWQRVGQGGFPGLNVVRFVDSKTGFVLGDGTERAPSGVHQTVDAGRTWKQVAGPRTTSWLDAKFSDARTGVLAGLWGRLATFQEGKIVAADTEPLGGRAVRSVHLTGKGAIAVGDGGLTLVSENSQGGSWSYLRTGLQPELQAACDFRAVVATGDHVWALGRPGTVLLHSQDRGAHWQKVDTGLPLPLNAGFFVDANRGWLVGEFGSILHTTDGGKNWRVQRRGGQKAAVLLVHGAATSIPMDVIARLGGDEGYLVHSLRLTTTDASSGPSSRSTETLRLAQAVRQAGGAAAEGLYQFPYSAHQSEMGREALLHVWDEKLGAPAAETILRQLVLALRIWRPDVVITDHPDPSHTSGPLDSLTAEAVREAFRRAADPKAFPEQLADLGLEVCKASKLYSVWHERAGSHLFLDLNDINVRLGSTTRDFAVGPLSLVAGAQVALPPQRHLRLLESTIDGAAGHRDIMQGIALAPGGVARRTLSGSLESTEELEKAIRERRNLQVLLDAPVGGLVNGNRSLAAIGPALKKLPDDQAAAAAFAIGSTYTRQGQWSLAREVFLLMVDRYPSHPLSAEAYRWLIRHNGSSEARRRHELGHFVIAADTSPQQAPNRVPSDGDIISGGAEMRQRRELAIFSSLAESRQWYKSCLEAGRRLHAFGPAIADDPSIDFCLNSAKRSLGDFESTRKWSREFVEEGRGGPWHDAAAAELWLTNRGSAPPRPVAYCRQISEKPVLDGMLDDPCWQGQKPLLLRSAVGDPGKDHSTEAWFAYDKDFLYVAIRCNHPAGQERPAVKSRTHDADVRAFDRVGLLLDLDRDYSSFFHMQVDQRGCVREECSLGREGWTDLAWNPKWFVAVHAESASWQMEAAIPTVELSAEAIIVGKTWCFNLVRVLPGRGVLVASLPADVNPRPEGMGLLVFVPEEGVKKQASAGR